MNIKELIGHVVLGNKVNIRNNVTGKSYNFLIKDVNVVLDLVKANDGDTNIAEEKIFNYLYNVSLVSDDVVTEGDLNNYNNSIGYRENSDNGAILAHPSSHIDNYDALEYLKEKRVDNIDHTQVNNDDYAIPRIGEVFDDSDVKLEGVLEPASVNVDSNNDNMYDYEKDEMPYLAKLKQAPKEFAKNRYYMMYNRFVKASEGSLKPVKYMTYDNFSDILCSKESVNSNIGEGIVDFVASAKHNFEWKYRKLSRNEPKRYFALKEKLDRQLGETNVMNHMNKGVEIIEYIRDNLLSEEVREKYCHDLCSTLSYLFSSSEQCYDVTQYPEVIRYKHLKKKLNFKRVKLNLDRLLNNYVNEVKHKAFACLTWSLPKFLYRIRLLRCAFNEVEGCKYLAKAYGSHELSEMILDLVDIRKSYLKRLVSVNSLQDIDVDGMHDIINDISIEISKVESDYNRFLNYLKTEKDLMYLNSQHIETVNKQEDVKEGNPITDWL